MRRTILRTPAVFCLSLIAAAGPLLAEPRHKVEIIPLIPNTGEINDVAVSPDGRFILSIGLNGSLRDGRPRLWNAEDGRLMRIFNTTWPRKWDLNPWVLGAISPDSTQIVVWREHLELRDLATGDLIRAFGDATEPRSAAFSPDGRFVVAGRQNGAIGIWESATGRLVRSLAAHRGPVTAVAVTHDGETIISGSDDTTVGLWRLKDGTLVRRLGDHAAAVSSVQVASGGREIISVADAVRIWDAGTGRLLRTVAPSGAARDILMRVAVSPDGRTALAASSADPQSRLSLWDLTTGRKLKTVGHDYLHPREHFAFFPDGRRFVQGSVLNTITVFDMETGQALRKIEAPALSPHDFKILPGGEHVLQTSGTPQVVVLSLRTGQYVRALESWAAEVSYIAVSPDGRYAVGASAGYWSTFDKPTTPLPIWDLASGRIAGTIGETDDYRGLIEFSPDGRLFVTNGPRPAVWDFAKRAVLKRFDRGDLSGSLSFSREGALIHKHDRIWDVLTLEGGELVKKAEGAGAIVALHGGTAVVVNCREEVNRTIEVVDIAARRTVREMQTDLPCSSRLLVVNERLGVVASVWGDLEIWDLASGQRIRQLEGHASYISAVDATPDGSRIVSGGADGLKLWSTDRSTPVLTLLAHDASRWLAISPEGLFAGTPAGGQLFSIVRGLSVFQIEQVHQSLFNPDLIREALAGDPAGEVREAVKVINLETVLDSGPAPQVQIISPLEGTQSASDLVTVKARITDRGKGIGRIEWRVNGITAAVAGSVAGQGPTYDIAQQIALDPGDNVIEVVAYNAENLLASPGVRTTVSYSRPANAPKPTLHVLAIGINAYVDKGWQAPGSDYVAFTPLALAVKDATAFGEDIKRAAGDLYQSVKVTYALDEAATRDKLDATVARLAGEIHPRDTFMLFAAAHGASENGRFFLIPQDYQSGPDALSRSAVGQERLQDWLANRIKARKAIILLDTCESGALVAGHTRARTSEAASEAGIGRLHEATGRPVLTAAASGQPAFEGLIAGSGQRHGIFTWALLDALRHGDQNGNNTIELSELVTHVQALVPKISAELGGRGRAAIGVGGSTGTAAADAARQSARFGSRGEDFVLTTRLH